MRKRCRRRPCTLARAPPGWRSFAQSGRAVCDRVTERQRGAATVGNGCLFHGRKSKTPPFRLPHVALIVETSTAYGRAILSGISQYVREHGPWTVYIEQRSLQDPAPPWLERWDGDGIIARASTPESARKLLKTGVPTVDLNDQVRGLGPAADPQRPRGDRPPGRRASDGSRLPSFRLFRLSGLRMVGAPPGVVHGARCRGRPSVSRGPARPPRLLEPSASLVGGRDRGGRAVGQEVAQAPGRHDRQRYPRDPDARRLPAGGRGRARGGGGRRRRQRRARLLAGLSAALQRDPRRVSDRLRSGGVARPHDERPPRHRNVAIDPPLERCHQAVVRRDGDRQSVRRQRHAIHPRTRLRRDRRRRRARAPDGLTERAPAVVPQGAGTNDPGRDHRHTHAARQAVAHRDRPVAGRHRRPRRLLLRGVPEHELPAADRPVSQLLSPQVQTSAGPSTSSVD